MLRDSLESPLFSKIESIVRRSSLLLINISTLLLTSNSFLLVFRFPTNKFSNDVATLLSPPLSCSLSSLPPHRWLRKHTINFYRLVKRLPPHRWLRNFSRHVLDSLQDRTPLNRSCGPQFARHRFLPGTAGTAILSM